jgi:hypothetical protein
MTGDNVQNNLIYLRYNKVCISNWNNINKFLSGIVKILRDYVQVLITLSLYLNLISFLNCIKSLFLQIKVT